MSEQEMQFADPDWQPGQAGMPTNQVRPRPVNPSIAAPSIYPIDAGEREYRGYAGVEYAEMGEQAQPQRGYLRPQPRRRHGPSLWLWIGIIVFALLFIAGLAQGYQASGRFNESPFHDHGAQFMKQPGGFPFHNGQQFKLGSFPTLNVVNLSGSITVVTGGPPGVVTVQSERSDGFFGGNGPSRDSAIQTAQSSDGTTLTVNVNNANVDSSNTTDVTITVPQDITLNLQTSGGDIAVSGVSGQMTLDSGSGSIELDGVTLQQHSSIQTDSGAINFSGAIDSQGTYQLLSNNGAITVGLNGGTPYHLHAITQSGTFSASGAVTTSPSNDQNGVDMQTDVGSNPQASLTLQTQTGDITLKT
mgnify:CR=1 FL=1